MTFECVTCKAKFAVRYGIHCQSQERETDDDYQSDDDEEEHHMCRPCFRQRLANEVQLTDQKQIRCFKEDCVSYIDIGNFYARCAFKTESLLGMVEKYLPRQIRQRLRDLVQNPEPSE